MTNSFLDLPNDLLVNEIGQHLDVFDLVSLTAVNKQAHKIFSSNEIWQPAALRDWFEHDPEMFAPPKVLTMQKYQAAYTESRVLYHAIKRNDTGKIHSMVAGYKYGFIGGVLKLANVSLEERLKDLKTVFKAKFLVSAINAGQGIHLHVGLSADEEKDYEYEAHRMAWDRLAGIEYFEYLPIRARVKAKVKSEYQKKLYESPENLELMRQGKNGKLVCLIHTILQKVAEAEKSLPPFPFHDSVFQVYNGFKANKEAKLDVFCTLCRELGFDAVITRESLIRIKDNSYKKGYCYLFIEGNAKLLMNFAALRKRIPTCPIAELGKPEVAIPRGMTYAVEIYELFMMEIETKAPLLPGPALNVEWMHHHLKIEKVFGGPAFAPKWKYHTLLFMINTGSNMDKAYEYTRDIFHKAIPLFPDEYYAGYKDISAKIIPADDDNDDEHSFKRGEVVMSSYGYPGVVLFAYETDFGMYYHTFVQNDIQEAKVEELKKLDPQDKSFMNHLDVITKYSFAGFFLEKYNAKTKKFVIADYVAKFIDQEKLIEQSNLI